MSLHQPEGEAYTLQGVLRNGTGAVDWIDLQRFITWLMCQPSKVKCPLELRQGRARAHNNVVVAVPYLDTEYIMLDMDKMKALGGQSSAGSSLFRLKSPRMNLERGYCNVLEKLLIMDVIEQLPCTGRERRTITDSIMRLEELPRNGYLSQEELEDLSVSPSELENTIDPEISQDQIYEAISANLASPRPLCKTKEELNAAFDRYKKGAFTYIASSEFTPKEEHDSSSNGKKESDDSEFRFNEEQIQKYAAFVHHLKRDEGFSKMFAMDCEMVSSTKGTDLARITVVDVLFNVVFDSLVMPRAPITNYRTIYSGITKQIMEGVTVTLEDIKETLGRLIDGDTILIGHSLNYDLKACEISHKKIIDTAFMYRDPKTSCKPSLLSLVKSQLGLDMKRDNGHDSFNDSVVTMYLALEGIIELCPFCNVGVEIISEKAFRILSNNKDTFSRPRAYLFDQMADSYNDRLSEEITVQRTEDDEGSVRALLECLKENQREESPCFYVLVLRDFQVRCIKALFQEAPNQKTLTKRLGAKVVLPYFTRVVETIDLIAKHMEHNDVLLFSNLVGNIAQNNVLWRAVNTGKAQKANAMMRLIKRIYHMVHKEEEGTSSETDNQDKTPPCILELHAKSQRITLSLLRREYETATRECELNWMVVLTKQVSGKRQAVSQEP